MEKAERWQYGEEQNHGAPGAGGKGAKVRLRVNIFHGALGVRGGGVPVETVLLAIPYSMEFCCISPGRRRVTVDACVRCASNVSGVVLACTRSRNTSMHERTLLVCQCIYLVQGISLSYMHISDGCCAPASREHIPCGPSLLTPPPQLLCRDIPVDPIGQKGGVRKGARGGVVSST